MIAISALIKEKPLPWRGYCSVHLGVIAIGNPPMIGILMVAFDEELPAAPWHCCPDAIQQGVLGVILITEGQASKAGKAAFVVARN